MPDIMSSRVTAVQPIAPTKSVSKQTKQESQSLPTPPKKPIGGAKTAGKSFGDCLQEAMSNMKPQS